MTAGIVYVTDCDDIREWVRPCEREAMLWKIKSIQGGKEVMMRAKVGLYKLNSV
jgi:hypothetical protein